MPGISADKAGYFSIKAYIANDTASVRLGFLRTTTDATATNFYFSDLTVSDDKVVDAPIVSEWEPYTLNITAVTSDPTKGTTSVDQAYYRRVGDSMEIKFDYAQTTTGTAGSGVYLFSVPSGYTIDSSKIDISTGTGRGVVGAARGS